MTFCNLPQRVVMFWIIIQSLKRKPTPPAGKANRTKGKIMLQLSLPPYKWTHQKLEEKIQIEELHNNGGICVFNCLREKLF